MPRTVRASQAGFCYHVLNRGNAWAEVFHKPEDYAAFLRALNESSVRLPLRLLAYCLMPNHFHLVVRPHGDGDLSRWMQSLMTTHVRRYLKHYGHSEHVWQGRFKAFPAEDDGHLGCPLQFPLEENNLGRLLVSRMRDAGVESVESRDFRPEPPDSVKLIEDGLASGMSREEINRRLRLMEQQHKVGVT